MIREHIRRLEQQAQKLGVQRPLVRANGSKRRLHLVGKVHHRIEAEARATAFDRVRRTKNSVYDLRIGFAALERQEASLELA